MISCLFVSYDKFLAMWLVSEFFRFSKVESVSTFFSPRLLLSNWYYCVIWCISGEKSLFVRKKSTSGKPALHGGSINFVPINKCCSQVTQLKSEPKVYSNNSTPGLYWTNSFEPMTTYRTANLPRLMASSQGPGTMLNRSAWSDSKSGKSGSLQTVDSGRKTFLVKDKLLRVTTGKIKKVEQNCTASID